MNLQDGIYKAIVDDIGISGDPQKPVVEIRYDLRMILRDGEWLAIQPDTIMGWHYLKKKDGALNAMQIHQFKEAFEWAGLDLRELLFAKGKACQVTLKTETWEGKSRQKVSWLNHENYSGFTIETDDSELAAIQAALAPALRALGTSKKPTADKPVAKKTAPKSTPVPIAPPQPKEERVYPQCTSMEEAWVICCDKVHEDMAEKEWYSTIAQVTGGKGVGDVTPNEWQKIGMSLFDYTPF